MAVGEVVVVRTESPTPSKALDLYLATENVIGWYST